MSLLTLPFGPYINITSYLDYLDIAKLCLLNKQFCSIIKDVNFLRCLTKLKFDTVIPSNVDIYKFFRSLFCYQVTYKCHYINYCNCFVDGDNINYVDVDRNRMSLIIDAFKMCIGETDVGVGILNIKYNNKEYIFDVQQPENKNSVFNELENFRKRFNLPINLCILSSVPDDKDLDYEFLYIEANSTSGVIFKSRKQYTNDLLIITASMSHKKFDNSYWKKTFKIRQIVLYNDLPCVLTRELTSHFDYDKNSMHFERSLLELRGRNEIVNISNNLNLDLWTIPFDREMFQIT